MKIFKRIIFAVLVILITKTVANSQNTWTQKTNFPGNPRAYPFGFSIGNRGYLGGGYSFSDPNKHTYNDFWEFNPDSNVWHRKSFAPNLPISSAVCFTIGNKGFITTGNPNSSLLWEFNPALDAWKKKANFPGIGRTFAVAFSIGTKGYVGLGVGNTGPLNDFWEYDTIADAWKQLANFPGNGRYAASAFSIGQKGYIGTGYDYTQTELTDFWEYNPATNKWTQKANVGTYGRGAGIGFNMSGFGYIGLGQGKANPYLNDLWQYNPGSDQWTQMATCDSDLTSVWSVDFIIGNKAYIGTGSSSGTLVAKYGNDFWEYDESSSGIDEKLNEETFSIYPNPAKDNFTINASELVKGYEITDINGKIIYQETILGYTKAINFNLLLANGLYFVRIISNNWIAIRKLLVCRE